MTGNIGKTKSNSSLGKKEPPQAESKPRQRAASASARLVSKKKNPSKILTKSTRSTSLSRVAKKSTPEEIQLSDAFRAACTDATYKRTTKDKDGKFQNYEFYLSEAKLKEEIQKIQEDPYYKELQETCNLQPEQTMLLALFQKEHTDKIPQAFKPLYLAAREKVITHAPRELGKLVHSHELNPLIEEKIRDKMVSCSPKLYNGYSKKTITEKVHAILADPYAGVSAIEKALTALKSEQPQEYHLIKCLELKKTQVEQKIPTTSRTAMYNSKAGIVGATLTVLEKAQEKPNALAEDFVMVASTNEESEGEASPPPAITEGIVIKDQAKFNRVKAFLEARQQKLKIKAQEPESLLPVFECTTVIGDKKNVNSKKLKEDAKKILESEDDNFDFMLDTPDYPESKLMAYLLGKVCILPSNRSAHFYVKESHVEWLENERNWDTIETSYVYAGGAEDTPMVVKETITPTGQLNKQEEILNRLPAESGLRKIIASYLKQKDGQETVTGTSSHNYTTSLPKLSGHTEIAEVTQDDNGDEKEEVLFSGERHGILAGMGIRRAFLKKLGAEKTKALLKEILQNPDLPLSSEVIDELAAFLKRLPKYKDKNTTDNETFIQECINDPETLDILVKKAQSNRNTKLREILRRQVSLNQAYIVFVAGIIQSPNYQQIIQDIKDGKPISCLSTALVTPGKTTQGIGAERELLELQLQAWNDLEKAIKNGTFPIELTSQNEQGEQERVSLRDVQILATNFGVNRGAFHNVYSLINAISGWNMADKQNKKTLETLLGITDRDEKSNEIGGLVKTKIDALKEQLNKDGITKEEKTKIEQKIQIIEELSQQIIEIWKNKTYREAGTEPYKMAARLGLLAFHLQIVVYFNCKSGKDRTGMLDVMLKYLSLEIKNNLKKWKSSENKLVPEYDTPNINEKAKKMLTVARYGSNNTFQGYSTGFPGYQTMGVPEVFEQFAGDKEKEGYTRHLEEVKNDLCGQARQAPGY